MPGGACARSSGDWSACRSWSSVFWFLGLLLCVIPGIFLWVALSVSAPALVLERGTVFGSMGRSRRLVTNLWWRTFGILLLAALVSFVVALVVEIPILIVGVGSAFATGIGSTDGDYVLAQLLTAVASIIAGALTYPFAASVSTLLYVDMRMRKEGLDIELMRAAAGPHRRTSTAGTVRPVRAAAGVSWPLDVPIDVGRQEAADAARRELSKAIYDDARPSIPQQVLNWVVQTISDAINALVGAAPGGIASVLALVAVIVVVVIVVTRRVGRLRRSETADVPVFVGRLRSAADYRAAADAAAPRGRLGRGCAPAVPGHRAEPRGARRPRPAPGAHCGRGGGRGGTSDAHVRPRPAGCRDLVRRRRLRQPPA